MKWVLNIMLNRSYGANAPAFFIKNKIPEVDEAMNIYKKYMSDEEYKDYVEIRKIVANIEKYSEGKEEGETNAKIEAFAL